MTKGSGLLTRLRDLFRCWLSDGCYDVCELESSLKAVFGIDRRLFDVDRFGPSGQKVAVTATTLSDAFTYIFSNYNGRARDRECGTYFLRPYHAYTHHGLKDISMFDLMRLRMSHLYGKRKLLLLRQHSADLQQWESHFSSSRVWTIENISIELLTLVTVFSSLHSLHPSALSKTEAYATTTPLISPCGSVPSYGLH